MHHDINNIDAIAAELDYKTSEEVSAYLSVFVQRFRELKESDQIIMKFQKKDFEERNLETIREFSKEKAERGEYILLL